MKTYDTLSEAIRDLQYNGYTYDFNLNENQIECKELQATYGAQEFQVDQYYRFEGDSNPDDASIVYAIKTNTGAKGLLVDAYGMYSSPLSAYIISKLRF